MSKPKSKIQHWRFHPSFGALICGIWDQVLSCPFRVRRWSRLILLGLLSLVGCLLASPSLAIMHPDPSSFQSPPLVGNQGGSSRTHRFLEAENSKGDRPIHFFAQASLQRAEQLYQNGQYTEAVTQLQQVLETARSQNNLPQQVTALRNLALVYQQLGEWTEANQSVDAALSLLEQIPMEGRSPLLAPVLQVRGSLQFQQGQFAEAVTQWEQAARLYEQLGEAAKVLENQINQAEALQQLGFYRRVVQLLTPIVQRMEAEPTPASVTEAIALRNLGEAQTYIGEFEVAQRNLEKSLAIAQQLGLPEVSSAASLSLGNLWRDRRDLEKALSYYRQAASGTAPVLTRLQAQLNQLQLFIQTGNVEQAQTFWRPIQTNLAALPASQPVIFAQINLAQSLLQLNTLQNDPPLEEIARFLAGIVPSARRLGDQRAESEALGTLGNLYERSQQWAEAQQLSNQALALAQQSNALDLAYRWQWQIGRIYRAAADQKTAAVNVYDKAEYDQAIAAYAASVDTLKKLRTDLVSANPVVQVSFQESVEPIHREFVELLLDPRQGDADTERLDRARKVIESLQLAELDNFLREACLNATPIVIDQIDQQAAVIYPIILRDRLEMIVRLPGQPLRHYTSAVTQQQVEAVVSQLRRSLVLRVGRDFLPSVQQLYDWMIRPVAADLAASQTKTLVFVLDGALRNLPMAALHDGRQFLVEQYSIALTPGLQLLNPRPLREQQLRVLTAGLSEPRQGFSALPNVISEIAEIQSIIPSQVLLNQQFTATAFKQALSATPTSIVHMATHGKFSSNKDDTFVLTWDGRLNIATLNELLQVANLNQADPIELLVLSACQTAEGDKQAALGLAGMAVRAGARSTIATLWQVNDEATAMLMDRLYAALNSGVSKAEALRQAQLSVLKTPQFRQHPYFWAPYVLVGNWL